jgi:tripartite-type tricarboxylate transporter receptor subunit TctC
MRTTLLAALVAVTAWLSPAMAQTYPDRPVRIIVPFPAGSALDAMARVTADKLKDSLGQPFLVENRPGVTGHIGGEAAARAKPDGYTILVGASSTHVVSPHVMKGLRYDPIGDFAPVSLLARVPNILVVHPSLPVSSVAELIAHARANPGKLTFGSPGVGGNLHLAGELLKSMAGIDMLHVPYTGTQIYADFVSGRFDLMIDNMTTAIPNVKAGKLRVIAIASPDRVPELPGVPTIAETVPGYSVISWAVILAPAGTPKDVLGKLNAEAGKVLRSADVKLSFANFGFTAEPTTPAETERFMRSEYAKWGKVVKDANIRIE